MAILGKASSAAVALSVAALAGCVLLRSLGFGAEPLAFSHSRHVVGEKLDCANCHAEALVSDEPGMPSPDTCRVCHAEFDSAKPPDRRVETLFREGQYIAARTSALASEVVFSHKLHAARQACNECHRGIERNERASRLRPERMEDCSACHSARKVADDCATCHREITRAWEPASHRSNWKRMHGPAARAHAEATADRCSVCHTESTCSACHQSQAPENHNAFWRLRGHGVAAMIDRENCAACHEPMSCERCHAETRPRNHVGFWGQPRDTHCLVCHQPLAAEGCVACHATAKSHLSAMRKPTDHYPGMDCRACHGVSQRLPHVDNGDDCNSCHL
jgi:c(7)-type cytochrome triheme protein